MHKASKRELRRSLKEIRTEYGEEVARIAEAERARVAACRRRLRLLNHRSAALAATRHAIATAGRRRDGRLYAEPVEPTDPLCAFVRARVEVEQAASPRGGGGGKGSAREGAPTQQGARRVARGHPGEQPNYIIENKPRWTAPTTAGGEELSSVKAFSTVEAELSYIIEIKPAGKPLYQSRSS